MNTTKSISLSAIAETVTIPSGATHLRMNPTGEFIETFFKKVDGRWFYYSEFNQWNASTTAEKNKNFEDVLTVINRPLREIMVYYKNGGKDNAPFCTAVNMAAHLTDKEMLDYFAPGAVFNVGAGEFDLMAEVERAEIIL